MVDELFEYYNNHYEMDLTDYDYWEMEHKDVPRELYDVCVEGICDPLIKQFGNLEYQFYYEKEKEFRLEIYIDEDSYDVYKEEWEERFGEKCIAKNMLKRMCETIDEEYPYIYFKFKKVEPYYDYINLAFVGYCKEQIYIYSKCKEWFVLDSVKEKAFFTDEKELKKYIKKHYPKHYKNYIWV